MNDQYPASPTPGQPDPLDGQQSAWSGGEGSSGRFGKRPRGPFSSAESNDGPFSSGGTTSLFHPGRKQAKSAWGTSVPNVQRPVSGQAGYQGQGQRAAGAAAGAGAALGSPAMNAYPAASGYPGQGGYNSSSAPGSAGAIAGTLAGVGAGAGYRNLGRRNRSAGPRFFVALVFIVISLVISFGGGLIAFFTNDDPSPAPVPTFSMPSPLPGTDGDPTPNPNNGQNADGSVTVGVWKVEKLEFLPDATERLAQVSDLPELDSGFRFAGIKMRFTNESNDAASPGNDVGVTVHYGDGGGDRSWEEMTILEADSVQGLDEVEPGESTEGWFYVQVPLSYTGGALGFFDYEGVANVESQVTLP